MEMRFKFQSFKVRRSGDQKGHEVNADHSARL